MNDKLESLNKKVRFMLKERQVPENIRKEIEKVYQEYRVFYEENIKIDLKAKGEFAASRNIEEYFETNFTKSISDINKRYKDKCEETEEVATTVLPAGEIEILQSYLENDRADYAYIGHIVDIVIDSITNSKNQMFRVLERLNTDSKRIEYIYEQIKLIENTAKLKLGNLKIELDIDNKQILEQIMDEYEQYKRDSAGKEQHNNKDANQEFRDKYTVSKEELNITKEEQEYKEVKEKREYPELPGNVIE